MRINTRPSLHMLRALLTLCVCANTCTGDLNSGCPSFGCLPSGSFSLSSGVPGLGGKVSWSTLVESVARGEEGLSYRGCVSDQMVVVCATKTGYVGLDPTNGTVQWNVTTKTRPYLPILDIYGDAIGSDLTNLYYIDSDGSPQHPINVSITQPQYGLVLANNSLLLLTSSVLITNQIITYGVDGVVSASIPLRGTLQQVNGTFVASGRPVISGSRAYVMTQFVPDDLKNTEAQKVVGAQRLYALDLHVRMNERITIAWHFSFDGQGNNRPPSYDQGHQSTNNGAKPGRSQQANRTSDKKSFPQQNTGSFPPHQGDLEDGDALPILTYFRNTVYINNIGPQFTSSRQRTMASRERSRMPLQSTLWAVKDTGSRPSLLFRNPCWYGPMAVYNTELDEESNTSDKGKPTSPRGGRRDEGTEEQVVWVLNRSPGMVGGYSAHNGSFLTSLYVSDIANMPTGAWLSSRLSVTRQSATSREDILAMGAIDANQEPFLVVLGAGLTSDSHNLKPRLLWSAKLGGGGNHNDMTYYTVDGQIVNYVTSGGNEGRGGNAKTGLIAMVVEHGSTHDTVYVKGIF